MAISIKHKDSVTGIVLYIFNLISQYKDINEPIALGDLLKYLKSFNKSETAIRMGLSRMNKSNVLTKIKDNGDIYYKINKEGKKNIETWTRGYEYFNLKYSYRTKKAWNGKWNFYILKDFNKTGKNNDNIIEELKELGKCEIEYNIWTSPYDMSDKIKPILDKNNIAYINTKGVLNTNIDLEEYIKKIYNLGEIKKGYLKVLKDIEKNKDVINNDNINTIELLPILGYTGWLFYALITKDPFLPKELIGDWIGIDTVNEFSKFRETIIERLKTDLF
jgi:DNA-binding transcriptional regulator PaaX